MSKHRNIVVPVPKEAIVVRSTGRVYLIREKRYSKEKQYNNDSRTTIGWLNDPSGQTMNPNDNYAVIYPTAFNEAANGKLAPVLKRIGVYAFSLACAQRNGVYPLLVSSCGPDYANAVMDYACYSIMNKSNTMKDYEILMKDQMLYSDKLRSDSWYSKFLSEQLSNDQIEEFKQKWATTCANNGTRKVWLCIDGSNSDCTGKDVEYAESGKAKSRKHINVYSYLHAVDAETGMPITYRIYRGGQVDRKALIEMIVYLKAYDIEIEGVILDRGFCDKNTLELLKREGYQYVVMMTENTVGFKNMLRKYGNEIRFNAEHVVKKGLYAVRGEEQKLFKGYDGKAYITLAYDSVNGAERCKTLTDKVLTAVEKANEQLKQGKKVTIDADLAGYIIAPHNDSEPYRINSGKLQKAIDEKGYSAIATSWLCNADEALDKYALRDKSEKLYMVMKTQLGSGVSRAHHTHGIETRHFVAFVASIIRHSMEKACQEAGIEFTRTLRELNFLVIQRMPDNSYVAVHNANEKQKALLSHVGIWESDLDAFANEESLRLSGAVFSQVHHCPDRKNEHEPNSPERRKPGRPKGSTKKGAQVTAEQISLRKPGRPKGAKNKPKTQQREAQSVKRKPGRPKGSKNKKLAVNAREKRAALRREKIAISKQD